MSIINHAQLPPEQLLQVQQLVQATAARIFCVRAADVSADFSVPLPLWIKRTTKSKNLLAAKIANACLLRNPTLSIVLNPGGEQVLQTEARRLLQLQAKGVKAPRLLLQGPDWLALSHVSGVSFHQSMEQAADDAARLLLWQQGLAAILQVHQQGSYLSQCFAKNMQYDATQQQLYFIDFEDDPLQQMSLAQAQARDWALFLQSTVFLFRQTAAARLAQQFKLQLQPESAAVKLELQRAMQQMRWLGRLPSWRWLGKDTMKLRSLGKLLTYITDDWQF